MAPVLPSDDAVIENCKQELDGRFSWYPSRVNPNLFVKFGPKQSILAEAENQKFAFKALEQIQELDRINVRIPQVYRVIERDDEAYIIMEFIYGETLKDILAQKNLQTHQGTQRQNTALYTQLNSALVAGHTLQYFYDQIATAIQLFLSFEIPNRQCPGPVGKGLIQHPLFKDAQASVIYESVAQLQAHVKRVANNFPSNHLEVDFLNEELCYCFSDLYEGNFMFTAEGTLYVLDHQHASIVPKSFMTYALEQPRPVCDAIKNKFDLPRGNLEAMKAAGYYFLMSSRKIGLTPSKYGRN